MAAVAARRTWRNLMTSKQVTIGLMVLCLTIVGACDDDSPTTNTVQGPSTNGPGASSGPATESTEGNVGDITGSTPVAAGNDDVVQGNQPMLSTADD